MAAKPEKTFLGAKHILDVDDLIVEEYHVPEWGGWVRIKTLSGRQRDELERSMIKGRGANTEVNQVNFRARIVAASLVDEAGQRMFGEDDVAALGRKSSKALDRVAEIATRLSGLTPEDVAELTKGFENAQSADSTSD